MWIGLLSEEALDHSNGRHGPRFCIFFGAFAFAIAPMHSTSIQRVDGVRCHLPCFLMLHFDLSRRVVKGILRRPEDRIVCSVKKSRLLCISVVQSRLLRQGPRRYIGKWLGCTPSPNLSIPLTPAFFVMADVTWRTSNVRFFIVLCMCPSCGKPTFVLGCANFGLPTFLLLLFLLLLSTRLSVCRLLLLFLLFRLVVTCVSVPSSMQCFINIPKMFMVN